MATGTLTDLTAGYGYSQLPAPGYVSTQISANTTDAVIFAAPVDCVVAGLNVTVAAAADSTGNLKITHVTANNGANLSNSTVVAANVFYGSNVAGNVTSVTFQGNTALSMNVGDLLVAAADVGASGSVVVTVGYRSAD